MIFVQTNQLMLGRQQNAAAAAVSQPGSTAAAAVTFSSGAPFPPCAAAAPQRRRRRSPTFAALTNGKDDIASIGVNRAATPAAVVVRHQGRWRCMVLVLTRGVGRPQHQTTTPHRVVVVWGVPLVVDQPLMTPHLLLMLMMPLAATRRCCRRCHHAVVELVGIAVGVAGRC